MKRKRVKHSFASYKESDGGIVVNAEDVAKILAKGWGAVPLRLNSSRAWEIYVLARAYLTLRKKLEKASKENEP